jgi:hypothetical protein
VDETPAAAPPQPETQAETGEGTIKRDLIALPDGTPFYLDELVALANAGPGELRTSVRDQNGVVHLVHVAARLSLKPVEEIKREQAEAERQKQQRRPLIALPAGPFDPLAGGFR